MEVSPSGSDPELDARLRVRLSFSPQVLMEKVEFLFSEILVDPRDPTGFFPLCTSYGAKATNKE